ncbi:MAG: 2OG-Fe(II) oxygenase [Planctomycetes bacterium]|jgi:hypothetical protein|nr:2OG-Fe(II) oxygenase [Planctomycetota bacterium]
MDCLDRRAVSAIDSAEVRAAKPFPWQSIDGLLTADGYQRLLAELPDLSGFRKIMGRRRRYGQASHDRYALDYRSRLALPAVWRDFVEELHEGPYRGKVAELLGRDDFFLTAHWHYTPRGCSVSPHCDAVWKLGSHIFYFNDENEWDPDWGGSTLVLDDGGEIDYSSAPGFEDFRASYDCTPNGNRSMLFLRTDHSWHGVRPLECPEDQLRKVFIVEYRLDNLRERLRARTGI